MRYSKMLRSGLAVAVAAACSATALSGAAGQDRVRWKMHSAFASSLPVLGTAGKRIESTIEAISDGAFQLKFFEPGALVPGIGYYDAVSSGALDAAYGSPGYNVGKDSTFAFFTTVPFGPGFGEFNGWMKYGGGYELYDELNGRFGVKGLLCAMIPPEASGWFREEIESLDDLKGLKMRFFGLGAKVMEKFGVSTQLLAGGDIYPALELGTIDATEFSMPTMDEGLGFYQVAKHYYLPGWHQPASFNDLLLNRAAYDKLGDLQKDWLRVTCNSNIYETYIEGDATQGPAVKRMQDQGVIVHSWPEETLAKFQAAWQEVAKAEAEANPFFKKTWESYSKWRDSYAIWRERGYLN